LNCSSGRHDQIWKYKAKDDLSDSSLFAQEHMVKKKNLGCFFRFSLPLYMPFWFGFGFGFGFGLVGFVCGLPLFLRV